jgi:competence protein ComEC
MAGVSETAIAGGRLGRAGSLAGTASSPFFAQANRIAFFLLCGLCALFAGELSAALRTARVAAPVVDRIHIATLDGYVEEMDFRRTGARFLLRVQSASGLAPGETPVRVHLKARLLPPARASLPGGYDFARDAWFAQLGAVGTVLGHIEVVGATVSPGLAASVMMAIDRGRNALARRIDAIVGGDSGAIAAAMVTGERDLLSGEAKEIIREAGIFHIITISGVQITLVAAIFFVGLRRLLALSETLALAYPIKKWAALFAIAGAVFYDLATGSRVGTERALFTTVIMLTSVLRVIEIFAVPGALLGTLLYPLGLDAFVWRYVGLGIDGVMWAARTIGSFPGSTIHLPAFAPWAIVFLSSRCCPRFCGGPRCCGRQRCRF